MFDLRGYFLSDQLDEMPDICAFVRGYLANQLHRTGNGRFLARMLDLQFVEFAPQGFGICQSHSVKTQISKASELLLERLADLFNLFLLILHLASYQSIFRLSKVRIH